MVSGIPIGTEAVNTARHTPSRAIGSQLLRLGHHIGKTLAQLFSLAVEFEALCEQYWRACQLGQPVLLGPEEMAVVLAKFASYGQQDPAP